MAYAPALVAITVLDHVAVNTVLLAVAISVIDEARSDE